MSPGPILNSLPPKPHGALLWVAIILATLAGHADAEGLRRTPAETMAVYTKNIAEYTTWPRSARSSGDEPFNLCSTGNDPNGVMRIIHDRIRRAGRFTIKKRRVQLREVPRRNSPNWQAWLEQEFRHCNVLFISADGTDEWESVHPLIRNAPIMTISESAGFARSGGIVEFEYDPSAQRMYMLFNMDALKSSGLTVSSLLLDLNIIRFLPEGTPP